MRMGLSHRPRCDRALDFESADGIRQIFSTRGSGAADRLLYAVNTFVGIPSFTLDPVLSDKRMLQVVAASKRKPRTGNRGP
jgi:hypothetical protein